MNCRFDNSMYTTIPPTDFDLQTEENKIIAILNYPEEQIREHNFEESYEKEQIKTANEIEHLQFMELIKHEPKQRVL